VPADPATSVQRVFCAYTRAADYSCSAKSVCREASGYLSTLRRSAEAGGGSSARERMHRNARFRRRPHGTPAPSATGTVTPTTRARGMDRCTVVETRFHSACACAALTAAYREQTRLWDRCRTPPRWGQCGGNTLAHRQLVTGRRAATAAGHRQFVVTAGSSACVFPRWISVIIDAD